MPSQIRATTVPESHARFEALAAPLRREIKLHCYRMLGSLHEAEDLVQDAYLRAWRAFDAFSDGSFRAWMYRIATNACLNALESRRAAARLLPDQLGPSTGEFPFGVPATELPWLEPYPDAEIDLVADSAPTPEAHCASRQSVQLAFIAAIQELPPRQRAVLLLCEVLGWSAQEAAALLEGTVVSVNSALQRARDTLARRYPPGHAATPPRPEPAQQELLERYLRAWESHDIDGFAALLREEATVTMPPWRQWFAGRAAIRAFFDVAWKTTCGGLRLLPTAANGQPAFAMYEKSALDGRYLAHSIHVITLADGGIAAITMFMDPRLLEAFGLPPVFPQEPLR